MTQACDTFIISVTPPSGIMNQFMMNQFAAAVNNKNNGMDAQIGFPGTQQGMINPQTLMYQNQLMYQVCNTTYIDYIDVGDRCWRQFVLVTNFSHYKSHQHQ